ncbi:hypothetical protein PFFCH_04154 [Plasmodium falciparum FCH/4]|uniref:Uncharacterized protein n=2 Tax=Plasmodium (Laverania) TaxID=418107 RepID=A0A024VKV8_PLAFA|nr:hypothetical protein PFFCH_04154 [Plasmodium falciparum FCH/4]
MKVWGACFFVALLAGLIKKKVECIELSASEISPHENKSTSSSIFQEELKFDESLKKFFKQNNKNEDEIERDNFFDENKNFIRGEILSDINSKFLVDILNNSTLNFLENLNSDNEGENKDYQIELEENCSPFYCEKIMKAKEIERLDDTSSSENVKNDDNKNMSGDNNNDNNNNMSGDNNNNMSGDDYVEGKQNINRNERNIKLHNNNDNNNNNNNLVKNMNNMEEFYNNNYDNNTDDGVDALYLRSVDDGEDKQRIVLTDGNNVYILEEVTKNENNNSTMNKDENNINKITSVEQEIKMHVPSEQNYNEDNILESFMDYINLEDSLLNNIDDVTNIQTGRETNIRPHNNTNDHNNNTKDYNNNTNDEQNKQQSLFDDNIFNLSEEELSKKIFDDIKLNSEDKIECHNFSDNEDKCNSFKKCTYVNIDNKDTCFLDYNYMLFLKNNNCALQSKSSLFVIGNNLDSLSLSYFLQCKKLNVNLLLTNKSTNSINTYHHKKNVIEKGHYTFALNDESYLSLSLLKMVERNRYSNNVSFLDVKERKYKINKYLFRIIYNLLKDYFSNKSINIGKNETLNNFILQHFDKKICDNLIAPYCYHYFNYSPENVLMRSFFPQFVEKIEGKKSLIKFLFSKKASLSSISKKQKIFRFMGGNNYVNELNDLDNISISDLSDVDPETNNIIIGVCDKISKPCGRRNVGSNWKIKLKGGLMKIDGKEMFFHGLQGELEF